ncbi:dihydroorotase [Sulfuriroseicoccus oceanibius]|uniref:Dihydroorotase n=2 Tax=Sulfuriroseicoccus oceanibius TaxID=2707525 RepID=A0A7T7F400_9BACT|nr:dihydroorotase [Sulfuriroseicoccus oceanibius]
MILNSPLDMHLHLRDGEMLGQVGKLSAESFSGAVIMPNLVPPVDRLDMVHDYRGRIESAIGDHVFDPFMTLFFREYSMEELEAAKPHIIGIKLYPAGATTNSEAGVKAIDAAEPTIRRMEELGIPLLIHGETHGFVMDREKEFLEIYRHLATTFPKLRITMEHITTADAVKLLDEYENLFATVTLQHLLITLDDVAGGMLNPHLFCKPIAKRPEDRAALLDAALKAHPKLMFGSDSAPHPRHKKECCGCAAGVFTAPIALQVLADLFTKNGCAENLQAFISDNAQRIYGVTPPAKKVKLVQRPFDVPATYGDVDPVVPMYAGETIAWSIESIDA